MEKEEPPLSIEQEMQKWVRNTSTLAASAGVAQSFFGPTIVRRVRVRLQLPADLNKRDHEKCS